jgi:hypothetical protein
LASLPVVVLWGGQAHGNRDDVIGENSHLVGLAVAIGILEDHDLVGTFDL